MKLDQTKAQCIFCQEPLDNSDEHIIPECLNGRLHSTRIICHSCNTNKFGRHIDSAIKKLFNPLLLILGLNNANAMHAEDPEGKVFLVDNEGTSKQVKPELITQKQQGKTYLSAFGDEKHTMRLFEKHANELNSAGYKQISMDKKVISRPGAPLHVEMTLSIGPEIILLLNKIAIEFCVLNNIDLSNSVELIARTAKLDESLDNVYFITSKHSIREGKPDEISHLITLRTEDNVLYAYIEIFNVVCGRIKIAENYNEEVNLTFYQDAISGVVFDTTVNLNFSKIPSVGPAEDFELMINYLFERLRYRNFAKELGEQVDKIKVQVQAEVDGGRIEMDEFHKICTSRAIEAMAGLSVHEYPYLFEDLKDEENDDFNHLHSNMHEERFEKFCELYNTMKGITVNIQGEGEYIFTGFEQTPFLERGGITLVKVYCVLEHKESHQKRYIPYRDFFEDLTPIIETS